MNKLTRARKVAFVAITVLAIVLAFNVPGPAREMGGPGFGGGRSYGAYDPSVESCPEEWVPVPAS